jgi:hypothetical protein
MRYVLGITALFALPFVFRLYLSLIVSFRSILHDKTEHLK